MIVFRISAEADGWYVCTDAARSGPCLSRKLAVERAEGMIEALCGYGEPAMLEGVAQVSAFAELRRRA